MGVRQIYRQLRRTLRPSERRRRMPDFGRSADSDEQLRFGGDTGRASARTNLRGPWRQSGQQAFKDSTTLNSASLTMLKRTLIVSVLLCSSYASASANELVLACVNQYPSGEERHIFLVNSKHNTVSVLQGLPEQEWVLIAKDIPYKMESDNRVARFQIAGSHWGGDDSYSGTSHTIYFDGQAKQRTGRKYEGKILVYSLPYPIPPNVRMAPREEVCGKVVFPTKERSSQ